MKSLLSFSKLLCSGLIIHFFIDLSKYNSTIGSRWGSSGVPEEVEAIAKEHQIKTISNIRTIDEARDALANGYGINVCSNYGFSKTRDNKGIARPSGNWAHAMAWTACDDTGPEPLFLVQNSWGKWNDGGHPDWGKIPDGSFLITADVAEDMLGAGGSLPLVPLMVFLYKNYLIMDLIIYE